MVIVEEHVPLLRQRSRGGRVRNLDMCTVVGHDDSSCEDCDVVHILDMQTVVGHDDYL